MHEKADSELLRDYAERSDESAFHELVTRYTDLVYSAAIRQVNSPDLARDVAQGVFTALAGKAKELAVKSATEASLAGWLFRSTRYAALNQLREDRRRLARERQIMDQLDSTPESDHDWERVRPILDEAMSDLSDADRDALLLRFFKNRDFRAIGESLGVSDDAAQKRVSRALEKLRSEFSRRGVTTSATTLGAALAANAVIGAPAGFASAFSAAALAGAGAATLSTASTLTAVNTIAMTTIQKAIVTTVLAAAIGAGLYQTKKVSTLRAEFENLKQQQAPLNEQIETLERQRGEASNLIAALSAENATLKKNPADVLKLRGEVGRLQEEKATISRTTALSKVTETPEARKFLREQQKVGMNSMYGSFAKKLELPSETREALSDAMADNIMENVDLITTILRDKPDAQEAERLFAQSEADLDRKVKALLGDEQFAEYEEYTRDLTCILTVEQFKGALTGEGPEKEAKKTQLLNAMREELAKALANAGLPADFQTVPILNFRNIAFESEAEKNLKLLDGIYASVAARGTAFLNEEELNKFAEFRKRAIDGNRLGLNMNRMMMAPIGK